MFNRASNKQSATQISATAEGSVATGGRSTIAQWSYNPARVGSSGRTIPLIAAGGLVVVLVTCLGVYRGRK